MTPCTICGGVHGERQHAGVNCGCPAPALVENGLEFDAACAECGRSMEHRFGAWFCPTHRDRGHVEFRQRASATDEKDRPGDA